MLSSNRFVAGAANIVVGLEWFLSAGNALWHVAWRSAAMYSELIVYSKADR